jgi:hypothetical protein
MPPTFTVKDGYGKVYAQASTLQGAYELAGSLVAAGLARYGVTLEIEDAQGNTEGWVGYEEPPPEVEPA